jgi:hypothetical protein
MENTLGIYIPAPVRYEPNELLARMFEELASGYLREELPRSTRRSRWGLASTRSIALLLTCYLVAGLLIGGGALFIRNPQFPKMDTSRWLGVLLLLSGIAFLVYWGLRYAQSRRIRHSILREESPIGRAQSIIKNLRWQRQQTSSSSVETKPWGGLLRFSSDTSATTTERDIGRPRLVADFQDFIRMIREDYEAEPPRIIIAIDELDKLPPSTILSL